MMMILGIKEIQYIMGNHSTRLACGVSYFLTKKPAKNIVHGKQNRRRKILDNRMLVGAEQDKVSMSTVKTVKEGYRWK